MERILVPLDGSSFGEEILPLAEHVARDRNAQLILLRAVVARRFPEEGVDEVRMEPTGEVMEYLKAVAGRLREKGLHVRWDLWHDEPLIAIKRAVKQEAADLIAMATHGRGGLSRLLLGSVAEDVVRSVDVPVLLVRGHMAGKPWAHEKVVVPLDGGESSEAIIPVVERLAAPTGPTIHLLEIIEPLPLTVRAVSPLRVDELLTMGREDAERYLTKVAEPLRDKGFRVEHSVRFGSIAETIVDVARQEGADLIAMVTHGKSGLERFFMGSVAQAVLRKSPVPLLLLKNEERFP